MRSTLKINGASKLAPSWRERRLTRFGGRLGGPARVMLSDTANSNFVLSFITIKLVPRTSNLVYESRPLSSETLGGRLVYGIRSGTWPRQRLRVGFRPKVNTNGVRS